MKIETFIRSLLVGQRKSGGRGRTDRPTGPARAPIVIVPGNAKPELKGLPYWKTRFKTRGFSKVLYTPSTLRIEVGEDWIGKATTRDEWFRLSPESPYNKK